METKLKKTEAEKLNSKLGFKKAVWVDCCGMGKRRAGGLGLLWNVEVEIDLISYSLNHIDVKVQDVTEEKLWRFISFYGYPNETKKDLSWNLLTVLKHQNDLPWLYAGDFNEILMETEKKGGVERRGQRIQNFRDTLTLCNLNDLGFIGYPFTWTNGREGDNNIQERLDSGFAMDSWSSIYPVAKVVHENNFFSDHCPLTIEFNTGKWDQGEPIHIQI